MFVHRLPVGSQFGAEYFGEFNKVGPVGGVVLSVCFVILPVIDRISSDQRWITENLLPIEIDPVQIVLLDKTDKLVCKGRTRFSGSHGWPENFVITPSSYRH